MKKVLFLLIVLCSVSVKSQSLGQERSARLKKSVVRILMDTIPLGTGFFASKGGWIVTCEHVIRPALIKVSDSSKNGTLFRIRPLYAQFENGEKVELGVMTHLIGKGYYQALKYDVFLVKPLTTPKTKFEVLKFGKWDDLKDGDAIYSSGFPFGIGLNFNSIGLASTKYVDKRSLQRNGKIVEKYSRNSVLLDLTINKGNSGGPLIKMGETWEDDLVVGVVSFNVAPEVKEIERHLTYYDSIDKTLPKELKNEVNPINSLELLFNLFWKNSLGISGAYSIDHLRSILPQ